MRVDMFKSNRPDWVHSGNFSQDEAASLGKLARVSPGTARLYSRLHGVSEELAATHLIDLLAYAALTGRVYQHRTSPTLCLEAPRSIGKYGVLLDLPSVRIISYETNAMSRTWVATRNIRRNARMAEARSPQG